MRFWDVFLEWSLRSFLVMQFVGDCVMENCWDFSKVTSNFNEKCNKLAYMSYMGITWGLFVF
jgi:hypothetical protein